MFRRCRGSFSLTTSVFCQLLLAPVFCRCSSLKPDVAAPPQALARLRAGDRAEAVASLLGQAERHLFTYSADDQSAYMATRLVIDDDERSPMFLLYRDGLLVGKTSTAMYAAAVSSLPISLENGAVSHHWSPTDDYHLRAYIAAAAIEPGYISRPRYELGSYCFGVFACGALCAAAPVLLPRAALTSLVRPRRIKRFDGRRVLLRSPEQEVDRILGAPRACMQLEQGFTARFYGEETGTLELDGGDIWIAVVFRSGKATRILSDAFFDPDWVKLAWSR